MNNKFNFSETPFLSDIINFLNDPGSVREVVIHKGSSVGCSTDIINHVQGYSIEPPQTPVISKIKKL